MGEAKRRKQTDTNYGKTSQCEFQNDLFSIFTGINPDLDEIAKTLDFIPEYAIFFVLNKIDNGILFFSKTHSGICWGRNPPKTVPNSTKTVLFVKSLFEKHLKSATAFIEYVPSNA